MKQKEVNEKVKELNDSLTDLQQRNLTKRRK